MTKIRLSLSREEIQMMLRIMIGAWDCYYDQPLYKNEPENECLRKRVLIYLATKLSKE